MEQTSLKEIRAELNARECAYLEHHLHFEHIQPGEGGVFDTSVYTPDELQRAKDRLDRVNAMMQDWHVGTKAWYIQEIAVIAHYKEEDIENVE